MERTGAEVAGGIVGWGSEVAGGSVGKGAEVTAGSPGDCVTAEAMGWGPGGSGGLGGRKWKQQSVVDLSLNPQQQIAHSQ